MKKFSQKYALMFCLLALMCSRTASAMEQPSITFEVNDDSLTTMYEGSYGALSLYIPTEELVDSHENPINLKELFEKNDICIESYRPWQENDWNKTYSNLMKQTKTGNMSTLHELPKLLTDAKRIIKSFLLTNDSELPSITSHFKEKVINPNFNRLFTYAKLQRVIKEKNLTHIRLPRKSLIIQDNKTNQYFSNLEAQKIIDNTLKVCVFHFNRDVVNYKILFNSDRYSLKLFAAKESIEGKGFSKKTMEELLILCQEAPFDVGFDNIFWDAKGDAVIIDTEYKGESKQGCCIKLNRYPVDPSL